MANRVILLDYDGPVFSDRAINFDPRNTQEAVDLFLKEHASKGDFLNSILSYVYMDQISVEILNRIHRATPYEIVVSSSWVEFMTKEQTEALFALNKIEAPLHVCWATPRRFSSSRIEEIVWWLKDFSTYDYFIVDDNRSGYSLVKSDEELIAFGIDPERLIMVNVEMGIGVSDFKKITDIWKNPLKTGTCLWS